jgi:uncharacterized membrane protein YccC
MLAMTKTTDGFEIAKRTWNCVARRFHRHAAAWRGQRGADVRRMDVRLLEQAAAAAKETADASGEESARLIELATERYGACSAISP